MTRPALGQSYDIVDLGTLGGTQSRAWAVNSHGEVVGWSLTSTGDPHAFLWLPAPAYGLPAGINDLGTLTGAGESVGHDINDFGQVVGSSSTGPEGEPGTVDHAFLWVNGVMTDLGAPDDDANTSFATAVNEAGEVVGGWTLDSGGIVYGSFLWLPNPAYGFPAGMNELTGLATGAATDINISGQVVGTWYNDTGQRSGWAWLPSPAYGLLAGHTILSALVEADAINDTGQIAATADVAGDDRAQVWESGSLTDLGTLGGDWSYARGISNAGAVVGESESDEPGDPPRAFLWDGDPIIDLNDRIPPDAGWILRHAARDINESGQIVGQGEINGENHACLLTPAVCGNTQVEGLEQCDDGNTEPGDGCDEFCQIEPAIPAVSEWGIAVLALVTLAAGSVVLRRGATSVGV
jgi:cysteine-rich repeat protein/probable HAF family extracellular repeat protein